MVLEIADDPDAAVNEQQYAGLSGHVLGLHDVDFHGLTILGDGLLGRVHPRHVDWRLVLKLRQDVLRLGLGQLPERARILVDLAQEGANLGIDPGVGPGVWGRIGGLGHEDCSEAEDCE
jgi:hypothetical protein